MIGRAQRAAFQASLIMAAFVTRTSNRPNGNRYDQPGNVLDGGPSSCLGGGRLLVAVLFGFGLPLCRRVL